MKGALARSFVCLGALTSVWGCNESPSIVSVGEFPIADSISDYLDASVVDVPGYEFVIGQTLRFQVVAIDPDDDPVSFSAGPLPRGATLDPVSGEFEWTPAEQPGYQNGLELYVVASDPSGAWDSVVVFLSPSSGYR